MKDIKKIILIILIIIVILLLSIYILKKENNNSDVYNSILEENIDLPEETEIQFLPVNIRSNFYTIESCVQKYIYYLSIDINSSDENSEKTEIDTEEEKKQVIYNILDKNYIDKNNININNIYDFVDNTDKSRLFQAIKINTIEKDKICLYSVYGKVMDTLDKSRYEYFYCIVTVDNINKTFMIKPMDIKEYETKEKENIELIQNLTLEIEKNNNNTFNYLSISDVDMARKYFNKFKEDLVYDLKNVYSSMNEDYKNKRFGTYESFKEYVLSNTDEFSKASFFEYLISRKDDYTKYICKDQYGNLYIFKEKNIMDYELMLDTYTIDEQIFIEEYKKASDEKKVQMNIDKFIQMINRQDYITSYNCIAEGFKNNYFNTQEQFENYIKNTFFTYNKFEFKNIEKKGSNLYVCTVNLTDLTGQNTEIKQINIIMQLNNNLDFEMSFGV